MAKKSGKKTSGEGDASRRQFVKTVVTGGVAVAALGPAYYLMKQRQGAGGGDGSGDDIWPVATVGRTDAGDYLGDQPLRPHGILWQKEAYLAGKGGIPKPSETVPVVVVGGGMSGLLTSWWLRDMQPLILEQAARLGGNSKGEDWGGALYSIGAAYISLPDKGSLSERVLTDLKIMDKFREEKGDEEAVVLKDGRLWHGFWQGVTDPSKKHEFERVAKALLQVREHGFPDVPFKPGEALSKAQHDALDRMTFKQWTQKKLGKIHPHIGEFFRQYCWSSFGGGYDELSAAQTLNFISADIAGVFVFPGGNSYIGNALSRQLIAQLPPRRVRTRTVVIDVRPNADGVQVCYEDADGNLRTVQAKACVFAGGKFIAKHVINDLAAVAPQQKAAIDQMRYRAYTVANLLVKKPLKSQSYELYHLTGKLPDYDSPQISEMEAARGVPFTDLIFGSWAQHDRPDRSVLTLYRALPYEGGRPELYAPGSYGGVKKRFDDELPMITHAMGLQPSDVESVRVSRWGHALPLAARGFLADGVCERASAPIGNRIFFAHQDNYANPAFESCLAASYDAATRLRKALG